MTIDELLGVLQKQLEVHNAEYSLATARGDLKAAMDSYEHASDTRQTLIALTTVKTAKVAAAAATQTPQIPQTQTPQIPQAQTPQIPQAQNGLSDRAVVNGR